MNELRKKILESDFYKEVYDTQDVMSIELEVSSIEAGIEEATAIFQCPVDELSYKVIRDAKKGIFNIGSTKYLVKYTHTQHSKSNLLFTGSECKVDNKPSFSKNDIINKDTDIIVRVKRDGVYLKILPPQGTGKRINDITVLEGKLLTYGVVEYDSSLAKELLESQTGELVRIGDLDEMKSKYNAKLTYSVSEDKMQAFITATSPKDGGREVDIEDALELLKNSGITYGVLEDDIKKSLDDGNFNVPILAAEGKQPIHGRNAKLEYLIDIDGKTMLEETEDEDSIDYKSFSKIINIEEGERLAEKLPATVGESGIDVFGNSVDAKDGKSIEFKDILGNNVKMDDEDRYIIASISGQVIVKNKIISVEPIFEVAGDVGPGTGNITFVGSVIVKGNVEDNYSIKAEGHIEVNGTVGKADLEADGDIVVKLGIQGNDNSYVKAGGNVIAKFIQFSNIEAGNNVIVTEAILNSNIDADNKIIVNGKRASASGGRLRALYEVNCKTIGSTSGAKTIIETGYSPAKRRMIDSMSKEKEELEVAIEDFQNNIKGLEQLAKKSKLDDEKKEQLRSFKEQLEQSISRRDEIVIDRENMLQQMEIEKVKSYISAGKEMFSGVELIIGAAEFNIRQEYKAITFFEADGIIQSEKYRGEVVIDTKDDNKPVAEFKGYES